MMSHRDETLALMWHMCEMRMRAHYRKVRQRIMLGSYHPYVLVTYFVHGADKAHGVEIKIHQGPVSCIRVSQHRAVVYCNEVTDVLLYAVAKYATYELDDLTLLFLDPMIPPAIIRQNRWLFNNIKCHNKHAAKKIAHVSTFMWNKYPPTKHDLMQERKRRLKVWTESRDCMIPFAIFPLTAPIGIPVLLGIGVAAAFDAIVTPIRIARCN